MASDAERWAAEKRALLATIEAHERRAAGLARRFKLLQRTVKEQQALLDQYQRAMERVGLGRSPRQAVVTQDTQVGDAQAARLEGPREGRVGDEASEEVAPAAEQSRGIEEELHDQEESATFLSPPLVPMLEPAQAVSEVTDPPLVSTGETMPEKDGGQAATGAEPPQAASRSPDAKAAPDVLHIEANVHQAHSPAQLQIAKAPTSTSWKKRRAPVSGSKSTNTVVVEESAAAPSSPKKSFSSTKRQRAPQPTWAEIKKQRAAAASARTIFRDSAVVPANKPSVVAHDKENQEYAYVEVVRNREQRAALPAFDCAECARYYAALGDAISAEQIAEQKQRCSRHRARYQPSETPDDFWRLTFPDSAPTT